MTFFIRRGWPRKRKRFKKTKSKSVKAATTVLPVCYRIRNKWVITPENNNRIIINGIKIFCIFRTSALNEPGGNDNKYESQFILCVKKYFLIVIRGRQGIFRQGTTSSMAKFRRRPLIFKYSSYGFPLPFLELLITHVSRHLIERGNTNQKLSLSLFLTISRESKRRLQSKGQWASLPVVLGITLFFPFQCICPHPYLISIIQDTHFLSAFPFKIKCNIGSAQSDLGNHFLLQRSRTALGNGPIFIVFSPLFRWFMSQKKHFPFLDREDLGATYFYFEKIKTGRPNHNRGRKSIGIDDD